MRLPVRLHLADLATAPDVARRWPLAALAAGLLAGLLAGAWQQRANEARLQAQVDAAAAQLASQLRQRMRSYEYLLFATRGAVVVAGRSAEQLTREAFRRFTTSFDLRERFPGTRAIGFARKLPREQDQAFVDEMRRKGEPEFQIRELSSETLDSKDRYLLMFLEPSPNNQEAEGVDVATEYRRREALRAAMLSGESRLSAPVTLLRPDLPVGRAFVLALPIYTRNGPIPREQRQDATFGWAVMPLVADEVVADLVDEAGSGLALALSDARPWGQDERFFTSPSWQGEEGDVRPPPPQATLRLPVFGREWRLQVQALPAFAQRLDLPPPVAVGTAVGSAFALLTLLLHGAWRARQRQREELALRRRTEAAEYANRAKSAFLAHMSHEIRTPLNAVIGLSQLLARMPLEPRQRQYVGHIGAAGAQLLALVNDVLDVSKIEAGEMRLEDIPFELPALLQELHAQAEVQAAHKPVQLRLDTDPALPPRLRGDPVRLRQVLSNLLGNAVKFTAEGTVTLRVRALPGPGPGHATLRFEVEDTGIGIEPAQQAAIFEPFTQADASTTRRFGGTGLGLSIVKRLVAMMGGEIALHSVCGQGSTFSVTVTLPLAD